MGLVRHRADSRLDFERNDRSCMLTPMKCSNRGKPNSRRRASPWCLILALAGVPTMVIACGSGTPPATRADQNQEKYERIEGSAEDQCLKAARAPRERVPDEPTRVGLRHILVRHNESRRKDPSIDRRRGMACLRALDALTALKEGAGWDETVKEYTDEKGAATRGGSLGTVTRDDLDPAFADAAFELDVDELSYVVESPAGFHIILRVE